MADIVAEAYAGAATDSEKMYRSWNFERQVHYHSMPLFGENELHDPVKYFNMYGTGFCDDAGNNFVSLNWHGGFTAAAKGKDPKLRSLNGHVQGELYFDGDYHFMGEHSNGLAQPSHTGRLKWTVAAEQTSTRTCSISTPPTAVSSRATRLRSITTSASESTPGRGRRRRANRALARAPVVRRRRSRSSGAMTAATSRTSAATRWTSRCGRALQRSVYCSCAPEFTDSLLHVRHERLVLRWDNIGKVAADHDTTNDGNGPLQSERLQRSAVDASICLTF